MTKRRFTKKSLSLVGTLIVVVLYFLFPTAPQVAPVKTPTKEIVHVASLSATTALVTRVVDGDTIKIDTGETVRYIGIDTPETVSPTKVLGCFGKEASEKNKLLVEGKQVKLIKDVSDKDKYGRLLRYVWVDDIFINDLLVRDGYAHAATFPPDVRYSKEFKEAQSYAREHSLGLWGPVCISPTP